MDAQKYTFPEPDAEARRWDRDSVAQKLDHFDKLDSPWTSQSQIAGLINVPRTTLQYWLHQRETLLQNSGQPSEIVAFFESPLGLAFLHRLVAAAHLVFVQANDCGIRNLCWFLELSQLDAFVAASYGSQRKVAEEMESLTVAFGQEEDQRLGAQMQPVEITVCEDETFHPQICLVGIEPVSNFILLEQYEAHRDADTWNQSVDQKLENLPVTVIQVTSDEAKALITHTEIHLGAHHSPDLFHVQYDASKATSCALANRTRQAEQQLQQAQQHTQERGQQLQACREQCPESEHVRVLEEQVHQAQVEHQQLQQHLQACQDQQQRATRARRGLSQDYHPFDLDNGQPLTAQDVSARLAGHFDQLEQVATEAKLSQHAVEKLAKARRVLDSMISTISFFWAMIRVRFWKWHLSESLRQLMHELIAGYYLQRVAQKTSGAQERERLRQLAFEILARARSPDGVWATLEAEVQAELEQKAQSCANIFQRSSSCVEGRNGHLSLKHHALHQLSERKLQVLTVLHNYLIRRPDNTTAAQRFYGTPPRDLFDSLLARLSSLARPRTRRAAA
jgi:hypothetical protein